MPKIWSRVWRQIPSALPWIDVAACQNMEMISKILCSSHACIAPKSLASIRESMAKIQLRCLKIDIIPSALQKKTRQPQWQSAERGQIDSDVRWDETSTCRNSPPKKAPIFAARSLKYGGRATSS
ncbi:hypothetical protein AVEN_220756-1 [Araneus ventricosus]|uniref:Uncharacterized protein n=1 Tax=Araneus ventricosus TaxID=182803 RepID=A0A4Y2G3Q4_ARAVE|nr:hypothetical protein AVEN_220756-1 [Araneus ventricosus]